MGTEVCSSLGSILSQLEIAKVGLQKIDEHIKKVAQSSGRFQNERNTERSFQNSSNGNIRGGPRLGGRGNFYQDSPNNRNFDEDRQSRKRPPPQETKTVFSRLSARPGADSDGEDEAFSSKKPRVSSQVIRDLPTKQQVLKAQSGDEISKARNRRMFGSLLGTLQKFKQEEIVLKNKEDKKAMVEKKIEEQAKQEMENRKKERQNLFAEREIKKATIKALESKMIRMQVYEQWEDTQKPLNNFIQTKAKPHIYWLPKKMTDEAHEKHDISRKKHEKYLERKQEDLKLELDGIEQRCLRNAKLPPGTRTRLITISQASEDVENDFPVDEDQNTTQNMDLSQDMDMSHDERVSSSSMINIKKEEDKEKRIAVQGVSAKPNVHIKLEGQRERASTENGDASPQRRGHSHDNSSSDDDHEVHGSKDQSADEDSQPAKETDDNMGNPDAVEIPPNTELKKEKLDSSVTAEKDKAPNVNIEKC